MTETTTESTPEKIDRMLREKALELLDSTRFAIEINFRDPKYQQLMWMAVAETAGQYASAAEKEAATPPQGSEAKR